MKFPTLIILALTFTLISCTDETAQWRGPNRDGIYPAKGLLKEWPESGPDLMLKIEGIGKGLSQPVLYKDIIYVTGLKIDSTDVLSAYDLEGNLLWDKAYSTAWGRGYPETRSTPTIENNRIYLLGGSGLLVCLDAKNGNILWQQDPLADFSASIMHWGIVESILLTPKAALCLAAGDETTLVAYDKASGEFLWKSESLGGQKAYASSSIIEWKGKSIVLVQTSQDLMGIDANNGEILWSYNTLQYHDGRGKGEAANTPLYKEGEIFITYGNQQPGMLFSLAEDGRSVSLKWSNDILDTHHGGLVLLEGNIYGSNMVNNSQGAWASVDWESGMTNWETEWFTKGSVVSADGLLYFYEEKSGNLALVQPDSKEMKIISSFRIQDGEGPHWAHPSIYDGKLLIRHGTVLLVYQLSLI